jgi:hypothetical protein
VIIIDRPEKWRNGKDRPRKPYKISKGRDWGLSQGAVTVYDKRGESILSLSEGMWTKVRRG